MLVICDQAMIILFILSILHVHILLQIVADNIVRRRRRVLRGKTLASESETHDEKLNANIQAMINTNDQIVDMEDKIEATRRDIKYWKRKLGFLQKNDIVNKLRSHNK